MEGVVVDAGNLMHEPGLQFIQAEDGGSLRIDPAFGDTAACRAWQDAKGAHHRADQALDVATEVRRRRRPIIDLDAILAGTAPQGLGTELLGIIEVKTGRQAGYRPVKVDAPPRQIPILGRGRPVQTEVEANYHAGCDIDRKRQPGPTKRASIDLCDNHDVGQRMIDLNKPERHLLGQVTDDPSQLTPGKRSTFTPP
jgi:hypothetical protein